MSAPTVVATLSAQARELGEGFRVGRVLPSMARRAVGPFVFFDHMGPSVFAPGHGIDVRPHPHIGLATVTYLFEGEILHRDSLGSHQAIRPGDVNWMTAGRGIVHSERTAPDTRAAGHALHGLQLWVALPAAHEEAEPAFAHHPAATLPEVTVGDARVRVLAGTAFGVTSNVRTLAELFYADVALPSGAAVSVPDGFAERAAYVVEGEVCCGDDRAAPGQMLVFGEGASARLEAIFDARLVLLGGAPLDGPRHLVWNFVSSSKARLEQARRDWVEDRFPKVPGDEAERIPFP